MPGRSHPSVPLPALLSPPFTAWYLPGKPILHFRGHQGHIHWVYTASCLPSVPTASSAGNQFPAPTTPSLEQHFLPLFLLSVPTAPGAGNQFPAPTTPSLEQHFLPLFLLSVPTGAGPVHDLGPITVSCCCSMWPLGTRTQSPLPLLPCMA
ncbi:hypothetical protein XENTR_v10023037 [Xenopus tropicalis]|nr:hypothetical protein XENTR_v10023037 [Xenopus tropicalis]